MKDFDGLLRHNAEEIEKVARELYVAQERFIDSASTALEAWYLDSAATYVTSDPQKTEQLGREKLKEMKQLVGDLAKSARSQVEKHLKSSGLWWDNETSSEKLATKGRSISPDSLALVFNKCRAELATLVSKYGYAFAPVRGMEEYAFAGEGIPHPVNSASNVVYQTFRRGLALLLEGDQLRREQSQANAKGIWDSL